MRIGLAARLALTVALFLVPSAAWVGYTVQTERERATEEVGDTLDRQLTDILAGVENHLVLARQTLRILSEVPEVQADAETCNDFLEGLGRREMGYAIFARAHLNGTIDCSTSLVRDPVYVGDRAFFRRVLETEEFTVGSLRVEEYVGASAVTKAYPLRDERGEMQGAVMVASSAAAMLDFDLLTTLSPGAVVTVVDEDHVIVARSAAPERYVGQGTLVHRALEGTEPGDAYRATGVDGIERLYVARPFNLTDNPQMLTVIAGVPVDAAYATVAEEARRDVVFVVGLLTLVALALVIAIQWVVLRPIKHMATTAEALRKGDRDARIGEEVAARGDEIGALGATLNKTSDDLLNRMEELRSANVRLDELDRIKTQIINTVAHELRTPMVALNLQVALLGRRLEHADAPVADALARVDRNVKRLDRLVQSLIRVADLQAGQVKVEARPLDLGPVLAAAEGTWRPAAVENGLRLLVDPTTAKVEADADALQEVLGELLDNAVKFTPTGGAVHVYTVEGPDAVFVVVEDTGIGLPPGEQEVVRPLEPRGDPVRGGRIGVGIGLYVARALTERMGGSIEHTSAGQDQGTRATIRLPRG